MTRARPALLAAFVVAVVAQLVGVYWPSPPSGLGALLGWDKVVHALLFGAPVLLGLLAGLRALPLVAAMALHAPVSEWLQADVLPHRSGDWHDGMADLVGIALATLVWAAVRRRSERARTDTVGRLVD